VWLKEEYKKVPETIYYSSACKFMKGKFQENRLRQKLKNGSLTSKSPSWQYAGAFNLSIPIPVDYVYIRPEKGARQGLASMRAGPR
jgi:hypothetical protein